MNILVVNSWACKSCASFPTTSALPNQVCRSLFVSALSSKAALPMQPKVWRPNLEGEDRHDEDDEQDDERGAPIPALVVLFWCVHRLLSTWLARGVSVGGPWSP